MARGLFFFLVFFAYQNYSFAQTTFPPPGSGQSARPSLTASSATTGDHLTKNYGSCGTETQQVMKSIKDFKSMVDSIKNSDKCRAVQEALNKTVPNIQDMKGAITADGMAAGAIRREKEKLRDIELEIVKLEKASSSVSPGMPPSPNLDLARLRGARQGVKTALSLLEARFAVGEEAQEIKQYEHVINTSDNFFAQIGNAFNEQCFRGNSQIKEQALFSMTGMVGMIIGATPLGLGISAASRLMKHFTDIDDTYQTTASDEVTLFVGIKCALRNTQKQHCEVIKARELYKQRVTEATACTDGCSELQNQSFGRDIKKLLNTVQKSGPAKAPAPLSPTDFFKRFTNNNDYEGSAEQSLVNLHTFANILKTEKDFLDNIGTAGRDYCRRNPNSYKCTILNADKAKKTIIAIKTSYEALDKRGISGNNDLKADLMKKVMELNGVDYLKEFTELVLAYSNYQSEKAKDYGVSDSTVKAFAYINNRSVSDLINIASPAESYLKDDDQMTAELASNAYMKDFSRIFTKHALKALSALENSISAQDANKKLKTNMCMELIGLKPVREVSRKQNTIHKKCQDAEIQIGEGDNKVILKYDDYKDRPFEERVCAFQNALKCAKGENVACSAHKRTLSSKRPSKNEKKSIDPAGGDFNYP